MRITTNLSATLTVAFSLLVACAPFNKASAQPGTASRMSGGRLGTLPTSDQRRSELLTGHMYLLGKTMEQAIEDLENAELKKFATSYKQMSDAYGQLADHVADAAEAVGAAGTHIELAKRSLVTVETMPGVDGTRREQLTQDVGKIRSLLIGKLATIRARVELADGNERQVMLSQMQGLMDRIGQMDQLEQSLKDGTRPLLPGLAAGKMRDQLDTIEAALEEEQRVLNVAGESVRLLVETTAHEMRRTLMLLEIEAHIPHNQLAQLERTRSAVQSVLKKVTDARSRASNAAIEILVPKDARPHVASQDELLQEVDQLLKSTVVE